jgi:hypothetical protein
MMNKKLGIAIGLAASGLIGGCGSSGESTTAMTPPPSVDAFTQSVQGVVATTSDTALPISIDGISATGPDNALPVGL